MALTIFPEPADAIAKKLGKSESDTEKLFYSMSKKGLILRLLREQNTYMAANFIIGMCCGCCCLVLKNLNRMDEPAKVANTNYYAFVSFRSMCFWAKSIKPFPLSAPSLCQLTPSFGSHTRTFRSSFSNEHF